MMKVWLSICKKNMIWMNNLNRKSKIRNQTIPSSYPTDRSTMQLLLRSDFFSGRL